MVGFRRRSQEKDSSSIEKRDHLSRKRQSNPAQLGGSEHEGVKNLGNRGGGKVKDTLHNRGEKGTQR